MINLKGCQKRIYHMKNIGGKYFDEAYLILKNDAPQPKKGGTVNGSGYDHLHDEVFGKSAHESDLAAEAEQIVREALDYFSPPKSSGSFFNRGIAFALGAASSSALIGTVALIIGLS